MSVQSILALVPQDYIRRMKNWARTDACPMSYAMSSVYDGARFDSGFAESPIPMLIGEARDTHAALLAVANRYRQAVSQFWQFEGRSLRWHGRRRGCSHETFEVWVNQGHQLHLAEIRRRSEVHHRLVESNARTAAAATASSGRTGCVAVVSTAEQVSLDMAAGFAKNARPSV